jgi:hypothetical protein
MHKWRRIDREGNHYDEVVTDPATGEVISETHERLSDHREHGSAKRQMPTIASRCASSPESQ